MIGLPGQLVDSFVPGGGNYAFVDHILIRIKRRLLTIRLWNLRPQAPGTLATAIADMQGNDLARLGVHSEPNPLSLNLSLRHEVARLIVWHVVTRPVAPSAVSYEDVREGNDPYRACGHGTHSLLTGT